MRTIYSVNEFNYFLKKEEELLKYNANLSSFFDKNKNCVMKFELPEINEQTVMQLKSSFLNFKKTFPNITNASVRFSTNGTQNGLLFSNVDCANLVALNDFVNKIKLASEVRITEGDGGVNTFSLAEEINAVSKFNNALNEIKSMNLSPFENFLAAYYYSTGFKYQDDLNNVDYSRSIIGFYNYNKIVCAGYARLLRAMCYYLNIDCKILTINHIVTAKHEHNIGRHAANLVCIKDDKYNIDGVYYADSTWDSKRFLRGRRATFCLLPLSDIKNVKNCSLQLDIKQMFTRKKISQKTFNKCRAFTTLHIQPKSYYLKNCCDNLDINHEKNLEVFKEYNNKIEIVNDLFGNKIVGAKYLKQNSQELVNITNIKYNAFLKYIFSNSPTSSIIDDDNLDKGLSVEDFEYITQAVLGVSDDVIDIKPLTFKEYLLESFNEKNAQEQYETLADLVYYCNNNKANRSHYLDSLETMRKIKNLNKKTTAIPLDAFFDACVVINKKMGKTEEGAVESAQAMLDASLRTSSLKLTNRARNNLSLKNASKKCEETIIQNFGPIVFGK